MTCWRPHGRTCTCSAWAEQQSGRGLPRDDVRGESQPSRAESRDSHSPHGSSLLPHPWDPSSAKAIRRKGGKKPVSGPLPSLILFQERGRPRRGHLPWSIAMMSERAIGKSSGGASSPPRTRTRGTGLEWGRRGWAGGTEASTRPGLDGQRCGCEQATVGRRRACRGPSD